MIFQLMSPQSFFSNQFPKKIKREKKPVKTLISKQKKISKSTISLRPEKMLKNLWRDKKNLKQWQYKDLLQILWKRSLMRLKLKKPLASKMNKKMLWKSRKPLRKRKSLRKQVEASTTRQIPFLRESLEMQINSKCYSRPRKIWNFQRTTLLYLRQHSNYHKPRAITKIILRRFLRKQRQKKT